MPAAPSGPSRTCGTRWRRTTPTTSLSSTARPTCPLPGVSAILASDSVIIPVLSDVCSTVGVADLVEQIDGLRDMNPNLRVSGVLFNQWHRPR